MREPLVSVIVPIYNTEEYLSECVESIIYQTYENLEIILVDDGSAESCRKLCDEYAKIDSRIVVIHKENGGLSSAREAGLSRVLGNYVMIVDSDDWIDLETIEKCVEEAEINNSDCVLFSYVKEYGNRSVPNYLFEESFCYNESESEDKVHRRIIGFRKDELQHPERIDNLSTVWGKLYKREIALKGKIVSEKEVGTSEDTIFNVYALEDFKCISYINRCFYHYRRSNLQAATMKYKPNLYENWKRLYQIFDEYISNSEKEGIYREILWNRVACGVIGLGLNEANAKNSIFIKRKKLKIILEDTLYKEAFEVLDYSYSPIKWKVFFILCKRRYALPLVVMLEIINHIRLSH